MLPVDTTLSLSIDSLSTDSLSTDSLWAWGPVDSLSISPVDSFWYDTLVPAVHSFLALKPGGIHLPADQGLGELVSRTTSPTSWIFWVLVSSLILLTIVRYTFPRRFFQVLGALFTERSLLSMLREGDLFTERVMLGMMIVFSVLCGLFLLFYVNTSESLQDILPFGPLSWIALSLATLFWWLLRSLLIWLIGFIFKTFDATSLYLSRILAMNMGLGIIFLLLLPLAWYGDLPWVNDVLLWLILGLNAYRIVRSTADGLRITGFGLSYLLLFALSVEGLPILLAAGFFRHSIM